MTREGHGASPPEDPGGLERELAALRDELAALRGELRMMRLQLDLFSWVDPPTGLFNRNGLVDAIEMELERSSRHRERFGLLSLRLPTLADIGRHHPDELEAALQHVAALLRAGLRDLDRVGRLDDTTFLAVMPLLRKGDHEVVLNRLTSILSAGPLQAGGRNHPAVPLVCLILVDSPQPPDAHSLLMNVELGLAGARPGAPVVTVV